MDNRRIRADLNLDFHIGDRVLFVDSSGGSDHDGEECTIIGITREFSEDGDPLDINDFVDVEFDNGEQSYGWFAYRFDPTESCAAELPPVQSDITILLSCEVES